MTGQNKYAKAMLRQLFPRKIVLQQIIKNFKKFFFTTCFQLYFFLTNEIASVHDSGACFIEYVFEFFFQ